MLDSDALLFDLLSFVLDSLRLLLGCGSFLLIAEEVCDVLLVVGTVNWYNEGRLHHESVYTS